MAQPEDKIEQYCSLVARGVTLSNKVTIDIDFGEERRLWGDKRLRDETTGRLKKFNSIIDALNFMGSQGWSLVNAFPQLNTTSPVYHFYFKRLFTRPEVDKKD
jgi:hypothetical protein